MKKILLGFLVLFAGFSLCEGQSWVWAKGANEDGTSSGFGAGIATDKQGNVYMAGSFYDTIAFGSFILQSKGYNMFIVKYDPFGNVMWAKQPSLLKPQSSCYGNSICIDTSGNILVTGSFSDSVAFGGDTVYTDSAFYYGTRAVYIAKYSPFGNIIWAKQSATTTQWAVSWSVTTDLKNNIYITGNFGGNLMFDSFNLYDSIYDDAFVACFNSIGTPLWAKQSNLITSDYYPTPIVASSIATDNQGSVVITGTLYHCSVKFDTITLSSIANEPLFLVKYDSTGNFKWAKQSAATDEIGLYPQIVSGGKNDFLITGVYVGAFSYDNINFNVIRYLANGNSFLLKIDPSGNSIWCKHVDSTNTSSVTSWTGWSVCSDEKQNVYLLQCGQSVNFCTIFIDTTSFSFVSYNGAASILTEFDSTGNLLCGTIIEGLYNQNLGQQIAPNNSESGVYAGGSFAGNLNYMYGDSILFGNDTIYYAPGGHVVPYIAKWEPCNSNTSIKEIEQKNLMVKLFPNPNTGAFTLEVNSDERIVNSVEVYNVMGQKVTPALLPQSRGGASVSYQINMGAEPNGVYLYRVIDATGKLLGEGKLIIQK